MSIKTLGASGPALSALGLGCMGMSDFYGAADDAQSIAVIHHALERGVTMLDTADMYGFGANETLVGLAEASGRRGDRSLLHAPPQSDRAAGG
jgi:aryl-alcohol dehydrogenase-like predicted oxidoreductase